MCPKCTVPLLYHGKDKKDFDVYIFYKASCPACGAEHLARDRAHVVRDLRNKILRENRKEVYRLSQDPSNFCGSFYSVTLEIDTLPGRSKRPGIRLLTNKKGGAVGLAVDLSSEQAKEIAHALTNAAKEAEEEPI